MIRHHFVIALRSLARHKEFSLLNITGLALGISCALLILLWVKNESAVDQFHTHGDRIYQLYCRSYHDGKVEAMYNTQGLLAQELKKVIPEVQYASGMEYVASGETGNTFEAGSRINKMRGFYVGADFLSIFSYPLLEGDKILALSAPGTIAISRKMAVFFFGSVQKAVGQTIRFEDKEDLQVSGVFEDLTDQSSQQFDFLRSWVDFVRQNSWVNNWSNTSPATFVQLQPDANPKLVETKLKNFLDNYKRRGPNFRTELAMQNYPQKYLNGVFKNGYLAGGRVEYVHFFSLVAIFILLVACINFMNLATARSAKRAREIGLRKTIGASRGTLIRQFYLEAFLLTTVAFVIGLLLTFGLLPTFGHFTGKTLTVPITNLWFWVYAFGLLLVIGLAAGSYPALFLSSLKPIQALKSRPTMGATAMLRKGLVVFQFTLSVLLILGMIVIYQQLKFIQTTHIGYDRSNLIYLPIEGEMKEHYQVFKTMAEQLPGILSVSKMRNSPTLIEHHTGGIAWPGKAPHVMLSFADAVVGYDFVKTLHIQLKDGRDFSKEYGDDATSYLVNETAVKMMQLYPALGQTVSWNDRPGKIIGVLRDFHFNSLHQTVDPLIVRLDDRWSWGTILIRLKPGSTGMAISSLENLWKSLNPKFPFMYQFSDAEYSKLYHSEEIAGRLSYWFALLAISISCLGLFGLSAYTAEQRTREIGIRKVLGASVTSVVGLLSKDLLMLVLIALLIASPIAWWLMNEWLEGFAYRIEIEWWMFATAGLLAVLIAWVTVCYQAVKAAMTNPMDCLRRE